MTTLDDLRAYLGPAGAEGGRLSDDTLTGVIAAETSAQARKCRVPTDLATEPDLYEAMLRRCQTNLARRALPLGLTEASSDSGQRSYMPTADPEVKRLEAPFRRRPVA